MIKINNLSFKYNKLNILDSIKMALEDNSITALIGLNGAGKTTLFRCLLKLEKVPNNTILVDKKDINEISIKEMSKIISFVPQLNQISKTDIIVKDYIVEARTPYLSNFSIPSKNDYEIVEETAINLGVQDLLYRSINTLSGGEVQLISIARALAQNTRFIILDEPTSALDIVNQYKVLSLLKKLNSEGKSILFSTHDPNQALSVASNSCLLKNGTIIKSGITHDVINSNTLNDIYGNIVNVINYDNKTICLLKTIR